MYIGGGLLTLIVDHPASDLAPLARRRIDSSHGRPSGRPFCVRGTLYPLEMKTHEPAAERCLRCSATMEWRHGTWQCPRCRLKLGCCEGEPSGRC